MTTMLLLILVLAQDQKKDLKPVNEKMAKVKSYHFTLKVVIDGEEKLAVDGEYFAPDVVHLRTDKAELAKKGETTWIKTKDEDWKESAPKGRRKSDLESAKLPHEWATKMADEAPIVKRERSDKIGSTTVDIYVYALGAENAKRAAEAGGHPFLVSVVDWSKTENGVLFFVGRDDLYYRVEQRFDSNRPGGKSGKITIEFSDFGRTKCILPPIVKDAFGLK